MRRLGAAKIHRLLLTILSTSKPLVLASSPFAMAPQAVQEAFHNIPNHHSDFGSLHIEPWKVELSNDWDVSLYTIKYYVQYIPGTVALDSLRYLNNPAISAHISCLLTAENISLTLYLYAMTGPGSFSHPRARATFLVACFSSSKS